MTNIFRHIPTCVETTRWIAPLVKGSVIYLGHKSNALVVRLMGGMGNQMFQYAAARHVAKLTDRNVYIDISYLCHRNRGDAFIYRTFELDHFNVTSPLVFTPHFSGVTVRDSGPTNGVNIGTVIESIHSANASPVLLEGYWQDLECIPSKEKLLELFRLDVTLSPTQEELLRHIHESESVMINVRRADFLHSDYHGVVGVDYYTNAVGYMSSKLANPRYFVFSDDVEWCREEFDKYGFTVVGHEYAGDSFTTYLSLMSACKHYIIPNSTFAWWSAYLGGTKSSIVIRPQLFLMGNVDSHNHIFKGLNWTVL
jgi:hypothetical protein